MKLRNKKTGVIGEVGYISTSTGDILVSNIHDQEEWYHYKSLAGLNAEWEDVENDDESSTKEWKDAPEEPKEHYFITEYGGVFSLNEYEGLNNVANIEDYKQIGNYFETEEEAGQAVEKIKAWKRLKDKGFRFTGWTIDDGLRISIRSNIDEEDIYDEDKRKMKPDLDLLFGGEE